MKNVRLLHACLITLLTSLFFSISKSHVYAQGYRLRPGGTKLPHGKPFLDPRAPLPPAVVRKPVKKSRAGITPPTIDLTANTPTVQDRNSYWSRDEQAIFFQSDRGNLGGSQVGNGFHIYKMSPTGGNVQALTGPLSSANVGGINFQTEPSANPGTSAIVYIETTPGGAVDLVEMNLSTNVTKSLVKNNTSGFAFTALNHPEYGFAIGGNIGVVFAGQVAGQPFHLYTVDTQSGQVTQLTSGIADDKNPTMSPDSTKPVIAFDSNRSNAIGSAVKANRDVWVIGINPAIQNASQVTNFSVGANGSENIQPAWSTDKVDSPTGDQHFVNGQQLIGFATNRVDTNNDGNANSIGSTHDIYWLKVTIAPDPNNSSVFTVTTPESTNNPAYKLPTSDKNHIYDDLKPSWPQFISTYRIAYDSDRSMYNAASDSSGAAGQPRDIFASTLIDFNAPTLVRNDETTGEIVGVQPRLAAPGQTVTFSVKVADFETGVRDVWLQIKNPNSKYQSADNLEHKVYIGSFQSPDGSNGAVNTPFEYESQRIFIGNNPNDSRVNSYADPTYITSIDDFFAFSGSAHPPEAGWLQMQFASRDATTGVSTYTGTWKTDIWPTDYYIDVIVYDNAVNPFTTGADDKAVNWKIYDNVWGFTTKPFQANNGILFVSDMAAGQKFFSSRFGSFTLSNVYNTFWGTESWMTEYDMALHPTRYLPLTGGNGGQLVLNQNTLGVGSYGAFNPNDFWTVLAQDPLALDGTKVDGIDLPVTQRYDMWRILCRGPLPSAVLDQYAPHTENQPPDTLNGETAPRQVLVSPRCVVWHSPYTGDLFIGPGTIGDVTVQAQLSNFVQGGGRLYVNGQDVAWALTLDGALNNAFISGTLNAAYVDDQIPGPGLSVKTAGFIPFVEQFSPALQLTTAGQYNPITNDPWRGPKFAPGGGGFQINPTHINPGPPFPPGVSDYVSNETNYIIGGNSPQTPHDYASPGVAFSDELRTPAGPPTDFRYGNGNTGMLHTAFAGGGRTVYNSFGVEGLNQDVFTPPNTQNTLAFRNRQTELMHNVVCWLRTGTVFGTIRDTDGNPLPNVIIRLSNKVTPQGNAIVAYTGLTDAQGNYVINGVEPEQYVVQGARSGFTQHRETLAGVHGGFRAESSFRMTPASPATIKGKITSTSGAPISGAVVQAKDNSDPNAPVLQGTSDINGDYTIDRVPSGTTYTVTVTATGFGASIPVNRIAPGSPGTQPQDTVIQPATTYTGFDFQLKPIPGSISGRVLDASNNAPIANAVVTATATIGGKQVQFTAVTDANGAYNLANLDPATYALVATAPGYAPNSPALSVVVVSNQNTVAADILLNTIPPGSVSGLVTRTSDNQPEAGVTITLKDAAGNTIATTQTVAPQTINGYTFNYKINNVPAGVTYTVTAAKLGFTPNPASAQAPVNSGVETKNINFQMDPLHTFPGQLTMVSAPYDYSQYDVTQLLSVPPADVANGTFMFATWSLGSYVFYPNEPAHTFHLGRGYFLKARTNLPLSTLGTSADPNVPYDIPLNPGWNMIGDPFPFDIDWTKIHVVYNGTVYTHDDAVTAGLIESPLWSFATSGYFVDFTMRAWKGYWMRSFNNVAIRVNPLTDGRAAKLPDDPNSKTRAVLKGGDGWTANLQLHMSGGLKDEDNFFGVSSRAVDGRDGFKASEPPVFGDHYASLAFVHDDWQGAAGGYGIDVRSSSAAPKSWEFVVNTTEPNETATLTWPNISTISRGASLVLTDLATGTARNMRSSGAYSWPTGDQPATRRFRIDLKTTAVNEILRITNVVAGFSNGIRSAGLTIGYNLSASADVEIRILRANGAQVRRLGGRATRAAGVNESVWTGSDDRGVAQPAGQYLVEIRAIGSNGTMVKAIAPAVLVR